jgi:hypothetical protein
MRAVDIRTPSHYASAFKEMRLQYHHVIFVAPLSTTTALAIIRYPSRAVFDWFRMSVSSDSRFIAGWLSKTLERALLRLGDWRVNNGCDLRNGFDWRTCWSRCYAVVYRRPFQAAASNQGRMAGSRCIGQSAGIGSVIRGCWSHLVWADERRTRVLRQTVWIASDSQASSSSEKHAEKTA